MPWYRSRIPSEEHLSEIDTPARDRQTDKLPPRKEGEPLDLATRQRLETSFGADLSDLRIHRDAEASRSAAGLSADAYTSGRDIYFAAGKYGEELLAHEVAHAVQQGPATARAGVKDSSLESEAGPAAGRAIRGEPAGISPAHAAPAIQRQRTPGAADPDRFHFTMPDSATIDRFDTDRAVLKPDHMKALDQLANKLIELFDQSPDSFVNITGHTDAVGAEDHNKTLGQDRADAVRKYLVGHGVPAETMHAGSLGETALKVATKQPEPRNRRVEIDIYRRSFRPKIQLSTPAAILPGAPKPPEKPPDPLPKIPVHVPTKQEGDEENFRHNEAVWTKAQEIKKEAEEAEKHPPGMSVSDFFGTKAREIAKSLGFPKWIQDKAEDFARDIPAKGMEAIFDQVTADKNLDDKTREAVKGVLKALPQVKSR